jgi:CRISPR-associated protein Csm2
MKDQRNNRLRNGKQQGGQKQTQGSRDGNVPKKEDVQRFVWDEEAVKDMVRAAESLGQHLKNKKVTSTQLRNAYGTMKKLEMVGWNAKTRTKVMLIKPRLAYAAERHGHGMKDLNNVIGWAIDAIRDEEEEDFRRFCNFFEAIVAYFRAAGGK